MPKRSVLAAVALVFAAAFLSSCSSSTTSSPPAVTPVGAASTATIESRGGSTVTGTATATEKTGGVEIVVDVTGATTGTHAVHIHEKGDCSAPDATSAGAHFNPTGAPHGAPDAAQHHAGDFGNMTVGPEGKGHLVITSKLLTVASGPSSVVGRAIIVHASPDDMTSQPAGNAGARIGCGVFR